MTFGMAAKCRPPVSPCTTGRSGRSAGALMTGRFLRAVASASAAAEVLSAALGETDGRGPFGRTPARHRGNLWDDLQAQDREVHEQTTLPDQSHSEDEILVLA